MRPAFSKTRVNHYKYIVPEMFKNMISLDTIAPVLDQPRQPFSRESSCELEQQSFAIDETPSVSEAIQRLRRASFDEDLHLPDPPTKCLH